MSLIPNSLAINFIRDSTDSTKTVSYDLNSSPSGIAVTISSVQTTDQEITFIDNSGTLSTTSGNSTYTNKSITDSTNNVNGIKLFSGPINNLIDLSSAGVPSTGQSLMATSSTTAAWTTVDTTNPMTTIGDMIYRNSSNVTARLPLGSQGQFLRASGLSPPNDVVWNEFIQPLNESTFFEDFGGSGGTATYTWSSSVSGGTVAITVASDVTNGNWIGGVTLTTTTTTGRTGIIINPIVCFGAGDVYFEAGIYLSVISVTGQTSLSRIGFQNSNNGVLPTNGVYFTNDTSTGAWIVITVSSSTTASTTTTSIPSAQTWHRMGILINSSRTLATFYVNGISIGTQTNNIPSAFTCGPGFTHIKTTGSNQSKMVVDYCYYNITYNSPRY